MKKIEKDLILKDLDYINNEYDIKTQKLTSIMSLFMDEEPEVIKQVVNEEMKNAEEKAEKIKNEEEQKEQSENSTEETKEEPIIEEVETENISMDLPLDIKALYRKIVMLTHPDKNRNNRNLELYSDLYRRAIKAKDDNDKAEIIYIAYKLKITEVYDVDDEHFGSVRKKIKEKEISSTNLSYNSFWVWYHTDNQSLKRVMVEQINQLYKRR